MSKKAYVVTEEYDGSAVVVWHEHRATAQRWGANELDRDFEGVSCRRAPQFDDLEGKPRALAQAQLDAGWWLGGLGGEQFTEEDEPFIDRGGTPWRSPWAWLADVEYRVRNKAAEAEASKRVTDLLWREFWYADRIEAHSYRGEHVYASVWLPYVEDKLEVREEPDEAALKFFASPRSLPQMRQIWTINCDGSNSSLDLRP